MRRIGRLLLCLCVSVLAAGVFPASAEAVKYKSAPAMFRMRLSVQEWINGIPKDSLPRGELKFRTYVRMEHLITGNAKINRKAADIANDFYQKLAPNMREELRPSSRYSSRLDIETVYTVSGNTVSALILARETFQREQLSSPFKTAVWNLETGDEIFLPDLFFEGGGAYDILADGIAAQLSAMFPGQSAKPGVIEALAREEAIRGAAFTLSGGELTLHYAAADLFDGKTNILHVRFYYPVFAGMWTDTGIKATDNAKWKFVALTFDDGPQYLDVKKGGSRWNLQAFRAAGWRVTYYIWGKNILSNHDVLLSQADNNHSMQNHSMYHPYGNEVKSRESVVKQIGMVNDYLAAVIGPAATTFRAPFGSTKSWVKFNADLPLIQWSIDPKDKNALSATTVRRIKEKLYDGAIVLLHDTHIKTTKAIEPLAQMLLDHGYMTVTVEELAAINGVELVPGTVYCDFREREARLATEVTK